jgi:glycolate oxidase
MRLTDEEYQAFEDIVGPEYISADPVIGESYNQIWGNKLVFGQKHTDPPAAVLCPGSVEEITAIVKVCNERDILFKALSSGFEWVATVLARDRGILLDLRRMDRILRIDTKNMFAVVEPFVSCHKLQLEANKLGLYIGKPGVGYSGNVIAVACCHQEMTISQIYTSGYGRNVLGCEWVLPTGDILNLGASGREDGWFSADGPGFSLRGILRGRAGANGGHGVLTKACVKLYPYYGDVPGLKREPGEPPSAAQLDGVPEMYRAFVFTFPTMESMLEASAEIGHAELACVLAPGYIATGFNGEGNDEEWAMMQGATPEETEKARNSVPVTINGHSARELAYREKAALAIMEKWGGYLDSGLNHPDVQARRFQYQFWSTGVPAVRATGDFMVSIQGTDGSPETQANFRPIEIEAFKPFAESGAILQNTAGVVYRPQEHYSLGCSGGVGTSFDPWDPISLESAREYQDRVYDPASPFRRFGYTNRGAMMQIESEHHIHERWGPIYDHCDYWLRRVKAMLDPNNVADWSAYIPAEYDKDDDDSGR